MSASQVLLTIRPASVHSSAVKNTRAESVRGLELGFPASQHSLWSVFCWSASLLPGSFLQFRAYLYFYDLHSTPSPQFLPSQNTVGFIRISPLSPWWYITRFRLLACCFEIPIQCLDSDTSWLWRPFIQHSLSRQSNEAEAFITFVFQMRTQRLRKFRPGSNSGNYFQSSHS